MKYDEAVIKEAVQREIARGGQVHVGLVAEAAILLLACDDGDVIGYRIQEIQRTLEHRTNLQEPINDDSIHVFLHRNVGASAWGLAVHREARIIAISAVMMISKSRMRPALLTLDRTLIVSP